MENLLNRREGSIPGPGREEFRPKCSIYLKKQGDLVFTPVHLRTQTMAELLHQLRQKFCPDPAAEEWRVGDLFQQTRNGLVFRLDDQMVDTFKSRQVFEVNIKSTSDTDDTVDITLIELEMT